MTTANRAEKLNDIEAYRPVWRRIADDIAFAIENGDYPINSTLPGANELALRYGVNRHTVRQSLLHLQNVGLLRVQRGRGALVISRRLPYQIGRKVSLRSNLGPAGLNVAGRLMNCQIVAASESTATMLRLEPGCEVYAIHLLTTGDGNPISHSLHMVDAARFADFPERLREGGCSISAAFRAFGINDYIRLSTRLSADVASDEDALLLGIAPGAPVLRSRAVDGLPDRTPIQSVDTAFAGVRVEMVIEGDKL